MSVSQAMWLWLWGERGMWLKVHWCPCNQRTRRPQHTWGQLAFLVFSIRCRWGWVMNGWGWDVFDRQITYPTVNKALNEQLVHGCLSKPSTMPWFDFPPLQFIIGWSRFRFITSLLLNIEIMKWETSLITPKMVETPNKLYCFVDWSFFKSYNKIILC